MPTSNPKAAFWEGFRTALPFLLVVIPFGLLFGAVATEAGLHIIETMTMTALVFAGAAQFTAISLMLEEAPTFIVLFTALAVNLRMAMYSAALVPHLGKATPRIRILVAYFMVDQVFALGINKYEQTPSMPMGEKIGYYFGAALPIVVLWYVAAIVGVLIGAAIPPEFSLDFAIPICFIALAAPLMRNLPHFVAAMVSIFGTLALIWVPYDLGLIIAAVFAMIVGAEVEKRLKVAES